MEHKIGELVLIASKSNSWFPPAIAHVFDLDAVAAKRSSPPSLSLVMAEVVSKGQDIPAVGW